MKTKTPNQVIDEIAQEHIGRDINLSKGLQAKIRRENERMLKNKNFITGAVVGAIVLGILFFIPSVGQAMKRLLGYVPDAGLVGQSSQVRILKEPVQSTQGETTISVKQAVVDSENTIVLYQVENIPAPDPSMTIEVQDLCRELPWLQLSDGSKLTARSVTFNSWSSGYSRHLEFPNLPASENTATLVFSCLEQSPVLPDTNNWEISLSFIEASPEMTIFPIVDLPTPTSEANVGDQSLEENSPASQISLALSKYIQTGEDIILFGELKTQSDDVRLQYVDSQAVHLKDVDGIEIPLVEDYSFSGQDTGNPNDGQSLALTYRSGGKYTPGQATLTVDSVWVGLKEEAVFSFDPGANPQPGQSWTLNKSVEVGGYTFIIKEVTMSDAGDGLSFTLDMPEGVSEELSLMDFEHPVMGGGGPGSYGFTYVDGFPAGVINVTLLGVSLNVAGPWQTTIDLPAFADGGEPTQIPEACLTQSSWQSALESQAAAIPESLGERIIFSSYSSPDFIYHVFASNLDGTNQSDLGVGNSGSLSPDNNKVVYASSEGLKLMDLSTGIATVIPDTSKNDQDPIWSPDGTKIAFTRKPASGQLNVLGSSSLMLVDADGTNQSVLLDTADANIAQTWLPDGNSLLYTVKGPEGASIRTINLQSGLVEQGIDLNFAGANVAISPDGKRLAYEEMLPGERYAVYISNVDGSNLKLISNADPIVITNPQWSPDGKWLILSVQDTLISPDIAVLSLVQVDTCQIIPLTFLTGSVSSWR